jgi:hypothetical protein
VVEKKGEQGRKIRKVTALRKEKLGEGFFENWRVIEFYGGGPSSSVT